MGEGLLEKILARLEAIETRLAGQTVTATLGETVSNNITVITDTPVTTPAVVASEPEVTIDKDGCPWDERINTATKTTTAKGVYTRKKVWMTHSMTKCVMKSVLRLHLLQQSHRQFL